MRGHNGRVLHEYMNTHEYPNIWVFMGIHYKHLGIQDSEYVFEYRTSPYVLHRWSTHSLLCVQFSGTAGRDHFINSTCIVDPKYIVHFNSHCVNAMFILRAYIYAEFHSKQMATSTECRRQLGLAAYTH